MAEIIYPTEKTVSGPYLLEFNKLCELDDLIDTEWQNLLEYREKQVSQEIDIDLRHYPVEEADKYRGIEAKIRNSYTFKEEKRKLIIEFKSGKKLSVKSFKEANDDPMSSEETPVGFSLNVRVGEVTADLSVGQTYNKSDMEISVSSKSLSFSRELLHKLELWARSAACPWWQQLWKKLAGFIKVVAFVLFLIAMEFTVTSAIVQNDFNEYKKILKAEAKELAKQGVNQENINRAVEIILKLETGFVPDGFTTSKPFLSKWVIIVGVPLLILFIILWFPPKTYLGFGLGEIKIKRWKLWLKIITVIIPVNILLPILLDRLKL